MKRKASVKHQQINTVTVASSDIIVTETFDQYHVRCNNEYAEENKEEPSGEEIAEMDRCCIQSRISFSGCSHYCKSP